MLAGFRHLLALAGVFSSVLFWSCTKSDNAGQIAGTATDAENTLAGIILDSAGTPVQGAEVRLVTDSIGFAAPVVSLGKRVALNLDSTGIVLTVYSDQNGHYEFSDVDSSLIFHLSVSYQASNGASYANQLSNVYLNSPALRQVPLAKAATVIGTLNYERGVDERYQFSNHFYLTVAGSGKLHSIFAGQPFVIDGLPAGLHEVMVFPADKGMVQAMLNQGLPMDSMIVRSLVQLPIGNQKDLGIIRWGLPAKYLGDTSSNGEDTTSKPPVIRTMSGMVLSYLGEPVAGAHVRLVLDTLGFSYSTGFPAKDSLLAVTDANGRWVLPIPAVASFNLEYLKFFKSDSLVGYALQRGIRTPKLTDMELKVDTVVLEQPARINGMIRYTAEPDAWINIGSHFRVGIKGTTRYVDVIAGQQFSLTGLPSGSQTLVYYPGDSFLWATFENELGSMEAMVDETEFVVLTAGTTQELQVDTYTLPDLTK